MSWRTVLGAAGYWDGGELLRVPTSGTTDGRPRVVLRTLSSWTASFDPFTAATGIGSRDTVVAAGPPTSMFVYARAHAAALGARCVAEDRWHPALLAGATVAHLTPAMLQDALADGADGAWADTLRMVVVAGAALTPHLRTRARACGVDVFEYYGAAELSFVAAGRGELVPFPDVDVEGRDGILWVRGPWTALGYADGADGPLRKDGPWCSIGDRGEVRHGVVQVHGRDGVVVCGGTTIVVSDVEEVLRAAPGVADCAVLGVHHERLGEVLSAVVVGGRRRDVVEHARSRLPRESRPVRWYSAARLPTTPAGKVSTEELRRDIMSGQVRRWV